MSVGVVSRYEEETTRRKQMESRIMALEAELQRLQGQ